MRTKLLHTQVLHTIIPLVVPTFQAPTMQPSTKRLRKTVKALQGETSAAEERIQQSIGKPEWIGLPKLRRITGRSKWKKSVWEDYQAELQRTLGGIVRHQAGPKMVKRTPRVLSDYTLTFLLPCRSDSVAREHVQEYLSIRLVCRQWHACVEKVISKLPVVEGYEIKQILEVGSICLNNCSIDCKPYRSSTRTYMAHHRRRLSWKHYMENQSVAENFDPAFRALQERLPNLAGRVELEYIAYNKFPHPSSIYKNEFLTCTPPCLLKDLANAATCPDLLHARERLLNHLMAKYAIPAHAGGNARASFGKWPHTKPVMYVVWEAKTLAVLNRMRKKRLRLVCTVNLRQLVCSRAPQTTKAWEEVWGEQEAYIQTLVGNLRKVREGC